jgi:Zn-dependent protease with chaperone function
MILTLWYKFIITKECKGDNFLIVYADDFVAGFQYKWEAENYYKLLKERMEKFGLQLEESKSRLLQSGAYIARAKQKSGESTRLETFDFLGFTFYCGRSRKGMPYIMPKTSSKKFRQKIRDIKVWLYANRDQPLKKLMGMLNLKLVGHYRYYGISFNGRMISNYKQQVRELLFKVLNRRSDRKSYTREGFIEMLKYYPLAMPKIYVIEDSAPNAFATGRDKNHAVVAATTGLLAMMDKTELEGVIAHELSHIGNRDMLVSTVAVVLVGFIAIVSDMMLRMSFWGSHNDDDNRGNGIFVVISIILAILAPIAATLIQLSISRKREYLADASGALLTRYPEGLASALEKIGRYSRPMQRQSTAIAHLYIANPFGSGNVAKKLGNLFSTHPPVAERVKILRGM